jgi:hypothetical protein
LFNQKQLLYKTFADLSFNFMKLRPEQLEHFDSLAENKFRLQMAVFLREETPETTEHLSDEELHTQIELAENQASEFNITSSAAVSQYITLYFMLGKDFSADPDINEYLSQENVDDGTKMQLLIDEMENVE